jgi:ABC-type Fe3+-hydroxamate transport system substrate-binding protein
MLSIHKLFVLMLSLFVFYSLCAISTDEESDEAQSKPATTTVAGVWSVDGTAKITFTYKFDRKIHYRTITLNTAETWTFNFDGTFIAQGEEGPQLTAPGVKRVKPSLYRS